MAHILRSVMYPPPGHPNHLNPPPIVASSLVSNHTPTQRHGIDPARSRAGDPLQQRSGRVLNNPPMFFYHDPKIEQPAHAVLMFLH
jgi:hypothetical protein